MAEVRAKKALGQHFLVDLNISRKICDALAGGRLGMPAVGSGAAHGAVVGRSTSLPGSGKSDESGVRDTPAVHVASSVGHSAVQVGLGEAEVCLSDSNGMGNTNERASEVMAADSTDAPCDVLEVGCGMGVLTQFLLKRKDIVTWGAEIDSESVEYLHAHFPEFSPRLIEGDFLKMDLRTQFPDGVRIIGNFPYNISSQIFFKVLEHRDLVPECVGMIQKEVAVRLAEPPGSKEYGILSVLLQAWYDIEYLFTVNETVFNPPPKVKSAVIRLRRNATKKLGCDEKLFVQVVKASFGQRRKMLRNALKATFGDFGGAEHPFFTQRAEQLSVSDFVALTCWVTANRR